MPENRGKHAYLGAHPPPSLFSCGPRSQSRAVQLLGRLLLAADAARRRGVFLSFATLEELVAINRANRCRPADRSCPYLTRSCGRPDPTSAICLLGRNAAGDVVVTQGARFFDWRNTSLHDEATSLRLLYRDPDAWRQRRTRPDQVTAAPAARRSRAKA